MNAEHTKHLLKTYPKLYRQYSLPMSETCMCWGFECGDGWFKIIENLSKVLIELDDKYCTTSEALQVKEKFGTLRFYCQSGTEFHERAIDEAERLSSVTCEDCGSPGVLRRGSWLRTLCDQCHEKGG
jgi:hypothetical protein